MENKEEKTQLPQEIIESAHTQQISVVELQNMNLNPDSSAGILGETAFLPDAKNSSQSRIPNLSEDNLSVPLIEPFSGAIHLAELTGSTSAKKKHFFGFFKSGKTSVEKLLKEQEEFKKQAAKAVRNTEKQIAKEKKRQAKLIAKKQKSENSTFVNAEIYTLALGGMIVGTGIITSLLLLLI